MKRKLILTVIKQFIESFLKPLKTLTFLTRDFFVFNIKDRFKINKEY